MRAVFVATTVSILTKKVLDAIGILVQSLEENFGFKDWNNWMLFEQQFRLL
jgi:hypothetical protein